MSLSARERTDILRSLSNIGSSTAAPVELVDVVDVTVGKIIAIDTVRMGRRRSREPMLPTRGGAYDDREFLCIRVEELEYSGGRWWRGVSSV